LRFPAGERAITPPHPNDLFPLLRSQTLQINIAEGSPLLVNHFFLLVYEMRTPFSACLAGLRLLKNGSSCDSSGGVTSLMELSRFKKRMAK
jgi:hypothetical protein